MTPILDRPRGSAHSLCYFRPITVAYVRKDVALPSAIATAWDELRSWMGSCGTDFDAQANYGLLHGSSGSMADCPFEACVELPAEMESAANGTIATQLIAGGVHIASGPVAGHGLLSSVLRELMGDPLVGHGLQADDARPAIITYGGARGAGRAMACEVTLNMPLRWSLDSQGRAA